MMVEHGMKNEWKSSLTELHIPVSQEKLFKIKEQTIEIALDFEELENHHLGCKTLINKQKLFSKSK